MQAGAGGEGEPRDSPTEADVWAVEGSSFVGRAAALRDIDAHFEDGARLVTIFGTAGLGKTRLLRRFGASRRDRGKGTGVFFCDLKAATSLVGILDVVAGALSVPLTTSATAEDASSQLGHAIGARGRVLLLLDNFEQIAAHAEATLGTWLRRAPGAMFLVTSRETLGLEEEVCFELPPLSAEEGAALFEDRARQVRPSLSLSAQDRGCIAEIAARLDNLPLALELAAARMAVLSPGEIAARLSKRFELLRSTRRDLPPRHATLEGAIAWSWRSLSPWEQAALAQCTVFRGGFSLAAAEAVLDLSASPGAPPALDALHALREKSLVRCQLAPGTSAARFSLYESIREFATPELDAGARRAAEARHARFYVEEAERWAELCAGARHRAALDALGAELANLHRVAELEAEPELSVRAALALDRLLAARGPLPARLALVERLSPATERVADVGLRVRYLVARADARRTREKLLEAREDLDRALTLSREHGRTALEGPILLAFGDLAAEGNRPGEAETAYREAAAAARLAGDASTAAAALCHLIDWKDEKARLDEIAKLVDAVSDLRARPALLYTMGVRAVMLGEDVCYELLDRARRSAEEIGDPLLEGRVGFAIGCAELSQGRLAHAAGWFERILPFHREVGYRRFEGLTLMFLAVVRYLELEGKDQDVRALAEQGLAITAETGERWGEGFATAFLSALDASEGRLASAEGRLGDARRIAEELGDPSLTAVMDLFAGPLDLARARRALGEGRERDAAGHAAAARERLGRVPSYHLGAARLGALFAGPVLERAVQRAEVAGLDEERPAASVRAEPEPGADLELGPDGAWFRVRGGERVSMRRRQAMRKLLVLLVEQRLTAPGCAVTPAALIAAGWPGERMIASAAANRLHNAVAVLRSLGLKGLLRTLDEGYALASDADAGHAD